MKLKVKCPSCNKENEVDDTKSICFCVHCGSVIELTKNNHEESIQEKNNLYERPASNSYVVEKPRRVKPSPLSITAFVFSLTVYFSVVGVILGVIALTTSKNKPKIFAILAISIGGFITLITIIVIVFNVLGIPINWDIFDTPEETIKYIRWV